MEFGRWELLALVFVAFLGTSVMAEPVAEVARIRGDALARRGTADVVLATGATIDVGDEISTGGEARLELRFTDGGILTLGGNSRLMVADYRYAPEQGGHGVLEVADGAFAVATGALAKIEGAPFTVVTPYASIGVRGTRFWGGPVRKDNAPAGFGVLVLDGTVSVGNKVGEVRLEGEGAGTVIPSIGAAPGAPVRWSRERVNEALSSVTF